MEHGLPGRELAWEQAPLAAALQQVEDGVQDLAGAVKPWTSAVFWAREERFDHRPFPVGQVGRILLFSMPRSVAGGLRLFQTVSPLDFSHFQKEGVGYAGHRIRRKR